MALINCPECGRENVSDSAESCPDCGFGIKAHLDKIREDEEKKERKLQLEKEQAEKEKAKLDTIQMPSKPSAKADYGMAFLLYGIWGILCLILPSPLNVIGLLVFVCMALWQGSIEHKNNVDKYERAMADFEKYQKDELRKIESAELRKRYNEDNAPKCPHCGSIKIEKITTVDRAISVGTVGLASGKIGKQYKCKSCKHMW